MTFVQLVINFIIGCRAFSSDRVRLRRIGDNDMLPFRSAALDLGDGRLVVIGRDDLGQFSFFDPDRESPRMGALVPEAEQEEVARRCLVKAGINPDAEVPEAVAA